MFYFTSEKRYYKTKENWLSIYFNFGNSKNSRFQRFTMFTLCMCWQKWSHNLWKRKQEKGGETKTIHGIILQNLVWNKLLVVQNKLYGTFQLNLWILWWSSTVNQMKHLRFNITCKCLVFVSGNFRQVHVVCNWCLLLFLSSDRALCTNWYLLTKVCHSSKAIPGIRFKQQLVFGERNKPQTRNQTSRHCLKHSPYLAMDNCPLSCRGQYQWASYGNSQHINWSTISTHKTFASHSRCACWCRLWTSYKCVCFVFVCMWFVVVKHWHD